MTIVQRISVLHQQGVLGGLLLIAAAVLAMIMENSALRPVYDQLLETGAMVGIGALKIEKPLLLWINDGLMAVFFFLVGLEVKRELILGRLSSWQGASVPIIAAVGGMAIPALVFVIINQGTPENLDGWAIPAATDIAFALGILALVGSRVPPALRAFLLALAIIDDLGAIIIIALFYTSNISLTALAFASVGIAGLIILNRVGVGRTAPYILVGLVVWVCVLKSGVHATLAGVITALAVPITARTGRHLLEDIEHGLAPWVAYMVMPIFAFANAGVSLEGMSLADLTAPITMGVALGLLIGKPIGIVGFCLAARAMGVIRLPEGLVWSHIVGASMLAAIGFTMSLFIGALAYDSADMINDVRLGVLSASVVAAIAGFVLLRMAPAAPGSAASPATK